MANTENLLIPLLEGDHLVNRDRINTALETIDLNALPKTHKDSSIHWDGWAADKPHSLKDVIRLEEMPSWGYLECTTAGTSGGDPPVCPYGPGDTVTDGSIVWTLRQINGEVSHGNLSGRSYPDQHPISAITGLAEALAGRQLTSEKGQANGYPSLDANGRVPITQLPANIKEMRVVANIAARNAIAGADLYDGLRVRVLDATGDPTVASGWAEYVYDAAAPAWIKLSEKESMDVVIDFANIQNVPAVLENLGDADGKLTYKGNLVYKDVRAVKFIGGDAELIYDWSGKITSVKVNCAAVRTESVEFAVEVATQANYKAQLNVWNSVGTFILPAGEVYKDFPITPAVTINTGDVIRASPVGDDTDLAFTVIIQNNY
ncbi:hypothetical protein M7775_15345 [Sporomusa sphaeroides DSM 2875]|uniref:hypothetical protein n=1 Tax=Sporomusa sphaeroides TaxID=47679 RepID=UPI00202EC882|nr:hypothetical protein [Sporomusa sphaeroides]MCM0759932.1 hypothetical protein [Sporomusa sphaeroides DSM 2875]